jgi:hypothetical protein
MCFLFTDRNPTILTGRKNVKVQTDDEGSGDNLFSIIAINTGCGNRTV